MKPIALSLARRVADLQRLREMSFDILVVGGGITGAGVALDAATRGLNVALVEQRDFASGTSSRSSKLIHGGLRYLEQLNFSLVNEALRERGLLLNQLSPHLVRPVSFLYPLRSNWERCYIGAGIALYDTLGGARHLPRHRHLSQLSALKTFPALRRDRFVGAIQYWDAQVDDARHTMEVVRTAVAFGATATASTRVIKLLRDGERIMGACVRDHESGVDIEVRARQVINATGVWSDTIWGGNSRGTSHVRASKGVHLVVPKSRIRGSSGLIVRTDSSVLFVIPWGSHWIIGTTDSDWDFDLAHPSASRSDIEYLLERVNGVLCTHLLPSDVEGVFAGLRPLLAGDSEQSSGLSREHSVTCPAPGLITIAGGKYTTYRVMAEEAVDRAVRSFHQRVPPSVTDHTPLLGAQGFYAYWNQKEKLATESGLSLVSVEHLLRRYGSLVTEILDLLSDRPELAKPIAGASDYLRAEAVYAALAEGALRLDDVLARRTRISIEAPDRGIVAASDIAALVGDSLGWDREKTAAEIENYRARVKAELASQQMLDDLSAHATRMAVQDMRSAY